MRKALVVGIDYYDEAPRLFGCVNDARAVAAILARNGDRRINFSVQTMFGVDPGSPVPRARLREQVRELFAGPVAEIALFYFAGHGHVDATGGYLVASDARSGDEGLALADVLAFANASSAENRIILLDSCHAGIAGARPDGPQVADIREGTTILAASTEKQYAAESRGSGLFTTLLVDALDGAAANLVGEISPGSVYAHIDQSLGSWLQRPVFKTNVTRFVSLRHTAPPIALDDLLRIAELFPAPGFQFALDPSFEPERNPGNELTPPPDPANNRTFAILQQYNRLNLLVPVGAPHMWHAAMQGKACRLTPLGEHYRRLVAERCI